MKFKWPILLLFFVVSAQAQMHRWVDAEGRVTYSDMPPPAVVQHKEIPITSSETSGPSLNFELTQASNNFPVTLYTSAECPACDEGRTFLKKRGIPFAEKTVRNKADHEQVKQAGGSTQFPFLTIGRYSETGFESASWSAKLTAAAYPESSQLPANYQYPAPIPAAPIAAPPQLEKQPEPSATTVPASPPPPAQGGVPGFQF